MRRQGANAAANSLNAAEKNFAFSVLNNRVDANGNPIPGNLVLPAAAGGSTAAPFPGLASAITAVTSGTVAGFQTWLILVALVGLVFLIS